MDTGAENRMGLPGGETLFYRSWGGRDGKPLLLLHGNMASSRFFAPWAPLLAGLRVIAPDMRGYGNSSYNKGFDSLLELADDVAALCDALGLRDICVGGWSTGGGVALELAATRPDIVGRLILIDGVSHRGFPVPRKDGQGKPIPGTFYQSREELIQDPKQVVMIREAIENRNEAVLRRIWDRGIYVVNRPDDAEYAAYVEEMYKQRCLNDAYWALASFNLSDSFNGVADGNGHIAQVRCPVLIYQGDRDYIVEPGAARANAAALGGHARLVMLENCGHAAFTDYPHLMADGVLEFMLEHT